MNKIKEYRTLRGITQTNLANLLNVSQSLIVRVENRDIISNRPLIEDIARVLNIKPIHFIPNEWLDDLSLNIDIHDIGLIIQYLEDYLERHKRTIPAVLKADVIMSLSDHFEDIQNLGLKDRDTLISVVLDSITKISNRFNRT